MTTIDGRHLSEHLPAAIQTLLDRMADGVLVYGGARQLYLNPALCSILGLDPEQGWRTELDWQAFLAPEGEPSLPDRLGQLLSGEIPADQTDMQVVSPHLGRRVISISLTRLDAERRWVVATARDVTELHQSRERLRRRSRLLQGIAHATHLLISHNVREREILASMEILCRVSGADRVCIGVTDGAPLRDGTPLLYRCVGQNRWLPDLPLPARWRGILASHRPVHAHLSELPQEERAVLEQAGVQSVLSLPIFANAEPRGQIRFDHINARALWSEDEIAALQAAANSYGSALAHVEATTGLEESEARYRRLVENAPDCIYRMSLPDGRYEYVSPAATEVFGYTPEETLRQPLLIRDALHPGWRGYFETEWEKLLRDEAPPTYEYALIHGKTGETRWLHQRNVVIHDEHGQPVALEGIVTDITARKKAEMRLRTQQAMLESVFRTTAIGIAIISERVILQVNDRFCRMTGYAEEELLRQNTRMLYPTEADYDQVGREGYGRLLREGTASVETRWRRKDGAGIEVLLTASPLDHHDLVAGVTISVLDITGRRPAAAQAPREKP